MFKYFIVMVAAIIGFVMIIKSTTVNTTASTESAAVKAWRASTTPTPSQGDNSFQFLDDRSDNTTTAKAPQKRTAHKRYRPRTPSVQEQLDDLEYQLHNLSNP